MRAIRDEDPAGVTRILFVSNLSHERLNGYLTELTEKAWVEEVAVGARRAWKLTPEGRRVAIELDRVNRLMDDFGLGL